MELSDLQRKIVEAPEDKIVVIARAAVGKTKCLTERVRFWLHQGVKPSDICAITYTNLAADEMRKRLADDYKDGMFIGTIHSLAARFLSLGGYGAKIGKMIDEDDFDKFFDYIEKDPSCVEHYSYVLVDEAQDLSENINYFIFNMINPEHFFVVGDPFQTIYESFDRQSSSKYMEKLIELPDVANYNLNENYRNKANILNYAKKILKPLRLNDNSIPMAKGGTVFEGKFDINKFLEWVDNTENYKDWAILCYSNKDVDKILNILTENFVPNIFFNQRKKTKKEIDELMNQNKVKVLTVWGAKGLGFPYVVVYGTNWMRGYKQPIIRKKESYRVDYVAYTRAMDSLMVCK